jgi:hypothetical protein
MTQEKMNFIRSFFPSKIEDIHYAQVNLDASDLSIADVLRNVNMTFPKNSRNRNLIASGNLAVAILCKSELLDPISGLLLLITGDDMNINVVSKNYIVLSVPESMITNDEDICEIIKKITKYIIKNFNNCLNSFTDFYVKFIYDMSEQGQESDEIDTNAYINEILKS